MNPTAWVQGLEGPILIAVICGLLFVEELGVPLFFAPGDIVLALAGIAIAGSRVNAVAMVVALAVAIVGGGILGREIFAIVGWERLMRVAQPLHARGALERASGLLRRGGWRAVFTARLLPGLRVHTTQVAGVSRMPRLTYVSGLVPATVVYIAAFVGLGAAVGRPVLALIHEAEHQVLLAAALIIAAVIIFLLTRAPVRRGLASLYAAGWTGPLKLQLDSVRLIFILSTVGLNFAGHAMAVGLHLPLFLDSIGTVLAGIIAGPWIGGSVGFISNLVSSNTIDPVAAPYGIVSFTVGFAAGLARYLNWQRRLSGWIQLWLVCALLASVVSTPLNFLMSGGSSGVGLGDSVYRGLSGVHVPRILAAFIGEAAVDLPDKLITIVAALLIAVGLPEQTRKAAAIEIDLVEVFTFVIRSPGWIRKLLAAALCLLFAWLVVPFLLLIGYIIDIARHVRDGERQLPAWQHRWLNTKDGFKVVVVLLIWNMPGALLSLPAAFVAAAASEGSTRALGGAIAAGAGLLAAAGSVWSVLILVLEAAILSQYLDRGFLAALHPGDVIRRVRMNIGLSIVVGVLVVFLSTIGVIGLAGFIVGMAITFPYAAFVGAYLVGYYARLTDRTVEPVTYPQKEPASL